MTSHLLRPASEAPPKPSPSPAPSACLDRSCDLRSAGVPDASSRTPRLFASAVSLKVALQAYPSNSESSSDWSTDPQCRRQQRGVSLANEKLRTAEAARPERTKNQPARISNIWNKVGNNKKNKNSLLENEFFLFVKVRWAMTSCCRSIIHHQTRVIQSHGGVFSFFNAG